MKTVQLEYTQDANNVHPICVYTMTTSSVHYNLSTDIVHSNNNQYLCVKTMLQHKQHKQHKHEHKDRIFNDQIKIKALNICADDKQSQNLYLRCRKCDNVAGHITQNQIAFNRDNITQSRIQYKYLHPSIQTHCKSGQHHHKCGQKQRQLNLAQVYDNMRAYTTLSNSLIQKKLDNINIDKIARLYQQLQSFIRFYRQWQNRRCLLSNNNNTKHNTNNNTNNNTDTLISQYEGCQQ